MQCLPKIVFLTTLYGCGASATSGSGAASAPTPTSDAPDVSAEQTAVTPANQETVAQPGANRTEVSAQPPVLAHVSAPPGITPLTPEEDAESKAKCGPLLDAVTKAARGKQLGGPDDRAAFVEEFLKRPPKLGSLDVARCSDLVLRSTREYAARSVENEAMTNIGIIVVNLASRMEQEPKATCPSAPRVPLDLSVLAQGPYASTPKDWDTPGWKCVRFQAMPGQRFQYEIRFDAQAKTYEVIARGFPVKGAEATELFSKVTVVDDHIEPTRQVFRRMK